MDNIKPDRLACIYFNDKEASVSTSAKHRNKKEKRVKQAHVSPQHKQIPAVPSNVPFYIIAHQLPNSTAVKDVLFYKEPPLSLGECCSCVAYNEETERCARFPDVPIDARCGCSVFKQRQ